MSVLRLVPLKGEAIAVNADEAIVGREANCNVIVPHPSVSRRHALIKRKQDVFFVVDQGSANGTFVDSKRIVDATLKEGAVLRFGSAAFKVEIREERPEESIAEDDLVIAATMVGQQSFSTTMVEGAVLDDDVPTPQYGTDINQVHDGEPAPTRQSQVMRPPKASSPRPAAAHSASHASSRAAASPTPSRGPAFWLMIGAASVALLLMGAAFGLGAAFVARRMGWL